MSCLTSKAHSTVALLLAVKLSIIDWNVTLDVLSNSLKAFDKSATSFEADLEAPPAPPALVVNSSKADEVACSHDVKSS